MTTKIGFSSSLKWGIIMQMGVVVFACVHSPLTRALRVWALAWIFASALLPVAPSVTAEPLGEADLRIFLPVAVRSVEIGQDTTPENVEAVQSEALRAGWKKTLSSKPGPDAASRAAAIQRLVDYQRRPSAKTALAVLADFELYAANKDFRLAAIKHDRELFLTLDALKYDLTVLTNERMNKTRTGRGRAPIAYALRVGSSGERFRAWVEWAARPDRSLGNMPEDLLFETNKLFASDDDITNVAHPNDEAADPIINEELNGDRAIAAFIEVTGELGQAIDPRRLMTEYLSPTKAYPILRSRLTGYVSEWPDYMEGLIRLEDEKYNGLFTEEQLRQWALKKGVVMEMQDLGDPARRGALLANPLSRVAKFKDSLAQQFGSNELFPKGVLDGTGWMANQYRQAFDVNKGSLKAVSKYTLRMFDWWATFKYDPDQDIDRMDIDLPRNLAEIRKILTAFYNPKTMADYHSALKALGGKEAALEKVRKLNLAVLRGGHRFHVGKLVETTSTALAKYHEERRRTFGAAAVAKPPTLDDLIAAEPDLGLSLNAMAGAYGNLPDKLVKTLNADLAELVGEVDDDPANPQSFEAELHKNLMMGLQRAREGATELQRQTAGLRELKALRAVLDPEINDFLKRTAGVDFDDYINKVALGDMKLRRLHFVPDENGWPRIREVFEQWSPADVARDVNRIHEMAKKFNWAEKVVAERLRDYFEGDPPLAVQALGELERFLDPTRAGPVYIEYVDGDGKTVRKAIRPTRGATSALNMGLVTFKLAIKGGAAFKSAWGIWDDLSNTKKLAEAIHKSLTEAGMSDYDRATAYAQALSSGISLVEYAEWISKSATKPWLLDKFGNTIETAASLSNGDYLTPDGQNQLIFAVSKDLSLLAFPSLVQAYFVYGVVKWTADTYTGSVAKSDVIDFLVTNGKWKVPETRRGIPKLEGVQILGGGGEQFIANDAGAPIVGACAGEDGLHLIGPSVMKWVAGIRPTEYSEGIQLKGEDGTLVKPRESLLTLFGQSGYEKTDPVLNATYEGVLSVPGSWARDFYLRNWQTSSTWTKSFLAGLGIGVTTSEDATSVYQPDPIRIMDRGADEWTKWISLLDNAGIGVRKNFGFLVSQYWVQRQILIETQLLCPLVKEAARRAMKDEIEKVEAEFLSEAAKLEDRMRDVDRRLWPAVAESARPAPDLMRGNSGYWKIYPIAEDFLTRTIPYRDRLAQLESAVKEGPASVLPEPMQSVGPSGTTDDAADVFSEEGVKLWREQLIDEAQRILGAMTSLVYRYEDVYTEVGGILGKTAARITQETTGAEIPGLRIDPVHIALSPSGVADPQEATPATGASTSEDIPDLSLASPGSLPPAQTSEDISDLTASPASPLPAPPPGEVSAGALGLGPGPALDALLSYQAGSQSLASAKSWRKAYLQNIDEQKSEIADRLKRFYQWLETNEVDAQNQGIRGWLSKARGTDLEYLAVKHPYWTRMLRLRMQSTKAGNAGGGIAQAKEPEIARLKANLTMVPPPPSTSTGSTAPANDADTDTDTDTGAAASSAAIPLDETAGETGTATFSPSAAASRINAEYDRLRILTGSMFSTESVIAPEDKLAVSDLFTAKLKVVPNSAQNGPSVDEIADLVKRWQWVFVPAKDGAYEDPECTFKIGTFWMERFTKKQNLVRPLLQAGRYYLQATALGENDVPLSQLTSPHSLDIAPAYITGQIEVAEDLATETVGLFFGKTGIDQPRPRALLRPVDLDEEGQFVKPLCVFHAIELPAPAIAAPSDDAASTPPAYPVNPFWSYAGIQRGIALDPRSVPSSVTYNERAQTRADAPDPEAAQFVVDDLLKLQGAEDVTIEIEVVDASDTNVTGDLILVVRGERSAASQSQTIRLEPGNTVQAIARFETPAGMVEEHSETVTYDPETHEREIALKIELPFYDTGNLRVLGRFIPDPEADEPVPVAGGFLTANISGGQQVAGDGSFELNNNRPVRLADALAIEALLYGPEDELLRPRLPRIVRPLIPGGKMDIGDFIVDPQSITIEPIEVFVTDWTGLPIPEAGTAVDMAGDALGRIKDSYYGIAKFSRAGESLEIRAAHDMPDGNAVIETAELTMDLAQLMAGTPPQPIELKLKIYAINRLEIVGSVKLDLPEGTDEPDKVKLTIRPPESPLTIELEVQPGEPISYVLPEAVRLVRLIKANAEVSVDGTRYTGRGSATVPVDLGPGGWPVADLGEILLEATAQMVSVPDFTGMTLDEARAAVGPAVILTPAAGPLRPPDEPEAAGKIYQQSKEGEVRRGTSITVWVHDEFLKVAVPNVVGLPIDEGAAILEGVEGADFGVQKEIVSQESTPGTVPGNIAAQSAQGWAERGATITLLYVPKEPPAIAEPASPPDSPDPDPVIPPPAPEAGEAIGSWIGILKTSELKLNGATHNKDSFFNTVAQLMIEQREKDRREAEKKRRKAEEERRRAEEELRREGNSGSLGRALGELGSMGADIVEGVGEAMVDALGEVIAIMAVTYTKVGTEMGFEGIDAGFALSPVGENTYRLEIPGMPEEYREYLYQLPVLTSSNGLDYTGSKSISQEEGRIDLKTDIRLSDDLSTAEVTIFFAGRNFDSDRDAFKISSLAWTLAGTLESGTVAYDDLYAAITKHSERVMARVGPSLEPIIERMTTTTE